MFQCEIFSLRKSRQDFQDFDLQFDWITTILREHNIDVCYKTELNADPHKLSLAVEESLKSENTDLFVFVNALNTSDSSSFRKLFYEFITRADEKTKKENSGAKIRVLSLGDLGMGYKGYCFKYGGKQFVVLPYTSLTQQEITDLILSAVRKALVVTDAAENRTAPATGRAKHAVETPPSRRSARTSAEKSQKTEKKESFLMSFIPHKGDSGSSKARKIIVLIAIAAFIASLIFMLFHFIINPAVNKANNDEIESIAHNVSDDAVIETTAEGETVVKETREENWDALKKKNKEIVGWIKLDGTVINYPVMYHKGDDASSQYYLNHNWKKEWSSYGTIFVDYRSTKSTKSKNVILHGHNMPDGSMFHELIKYSDRFNGNLNYYKKHAVYTFNTPEGDSKWKVISVFKTSTQYAHGEFFNYMQGEFNSDAEFMNFVYNVRIRSMFNIPVTVNENDQILTLSTCSYEYYNFRTVVVLRKVRPGEDENVDVDLATVNTKPFMPEVYYTDRGEKRPDPLTFKKAYKKGLITWYDGEYTGPDDKTHLQGSEVLTATVAANPTTPSSTNRAVYTVTYKNLDGTDFAYYTVFEGDPVPVPDKTPVFDDPNYTYTFNHWDMNINGVDFQHLNANLTIYPVFDHKLKQ